MNFFMNNSLVASLELLSDGDRSERDRDVERDREWLRLLLDDQLRERLRDRRGNRNISSTL